MSALLSTSLTGPRRWSMASVTRSGAAAWIIVGVAVLALTIVDADRFWASSNLATVLTATVVLGLVGLAQLVVVLSGGIDLSVGSNATLSAVLTAVLIDGYPIRTVPVILAMVALGALIGITHGLLVAVLKLPPFIVTLATLYLLQGVVFLVTTTPAGRVTSQLSALALRRIGPFPYSIVVLAVATVVVFALLHRTVFGRQLYAVGGDPHAARSSGVPVTRVLLTAYIIGGVLAALAGVMLAARATIGSPTAGAGLELSAITVVVIGGASLMGGRGTITGTMGGVFLLALVSSSVTLLQLPASLNDLLQGIVILAAAALFVTRARR